MKQKLKVGIIGLGGRGYGMLPCLLGMKDVEYTMVCDPYEDRVTQAQDKIEEATKVRPAGTTDYRDVIAAPDMDCVLIYSSWEAHVDVAVAAMKAGKYVGMEVGGAYDIEDCWRLIRAYEETGVHLMMLENCCYGEKELALLRMVREGKFGRVVHCRASYEHDLRWEVAGGIKNRHYRLKNFRHRCGELYPTHGLGPMCNLLRINRGNRLVSLTSMSSCAEGLKDWLKEKEPADSPVQNMPIKQGDMTTTMIKCAGGETILLSNEITLPRPYSRGNRVDGTRGVYMEDGNQIYLWDDNYDVQIDHEKWSSFDEYINKFAHPIWKRYRTAGVREGHGGMDYLVLSAFYDSVRNNVEPPVDVYDAATWMAITCLSEQSIALGSQPVAIPDFTRGQWINPRPMPKNCYALDEVYEDEVYEHMFDDILEEA